MSGMPSFIQSLPPAVRAMISQQCGGDWTRCYQDEDGAVVIANTSGARPRPQKITRTELPATGETKAAQNKAKKAATPKPPAGKKAVARKTAPPRPDPPPPVRPAPAPRAKRSPSTAPAFSEPPSHPWPHPEPADPRDTVRMLGVRWIPGSGAEVDRERLAGNAMQLVEVCRHGVPEEFGIKYFDDVLDLGVDLDGARSCMRHPERVLIDPLTADKGWPVLRFHKASVTTVVGFHYRIPMVLAVYFAETIFRTQSAHIGGTGGGGARKQKGTPTSARQLINALKALGCTFDEREDRPEVSFAGEALGQVTIGRGLGTAASFDSDYNRMMRKCDAIRRQMARIPVGANN